MLPKTFNAQKWFDKQVSSMERGLHSFFVQRGDDFDFSFTSTYEIDLVGRLVVRDLEKLSTFFLREVSITSLSFINCPNIHTIIVTGKEEFVNLDLSHCNSKNLQLLLRQETRFMTTNMNLNSSYLLGLNPYNLSNFILDSATENLLTYFLPNSKNSKNWEDSIKLKRVAIENFQKYFNAKFSDDKLWELKSFLLYSCFSNYLKDKRKLPAEIEYKIFQYLPSDRRLMEISISFFKYHSNKKSKNFQLKSDVNSFLLTGKFIEKNISQKTGFNQLKTTISFYSVLAIVTLFFVYLTSKLIVYLFSWEVKRNRALEKENSDLKE